VAVPNPSSSGSTLFSWHLFLNLITGPFPIHRALFQFIAYFDNKQLQNPCTKLHGIK
jgi:hypothetical protein